MQNEIGLILFPIALGLALLRSFKLLAFTSILGDFAVASGVIVTIIHGFQTQHATVDLPQLNVGGLPPAIGNLSFLFLSHIVILPMSQSLRGDLKDRTRFVKVTTYSYILITLANTVFGECSWLNAASLTTTVDQVHWCTCCFKVTPKAM